ncbi:hypothetical protein H6P81_013855 [Aristolochia fimbriata]|uniref:Uncharacterized protein n=1 Tax=Aristolochia fimbriata TaxID=158543 RepID=A0AAV7EFW5_ARIFI|nr:hypothetical protein H6P81_013855 [Aristolochia fimbriata]
MPVIYGRNQRKLQYVQEVADAGNVFLCLFFFLVDVQLVENFLIVDVLATTSLLSVSCPTQFREPLA